MKSLYTDDHEYWQNTCKNADCNSFNPSYKLHCENSKTRPPDCPAFKKKNKEIESDKRKIRKMVESAIKAYKKNPGDETIDRLVNHFYDNKFRIKKDGE